MSETKKADQLVRWEYRTLVIVPGKGLDEINSLGIDGWELACMIRCPDSMRIAYLKRPLIEKEPEPEKPTKRSQVWIGGDHEGERMPSTVRFFTYQSSSQLVKSTTVFYRDGNLTGKKWGDLEDDTTPPKPVIKKSDVLIVGDTSMSSRQRDILAKLNGKQYHCRAISKDDPVWMVDQEDWSCEWSDCV